MFRMPPQIDPAEEKKRVQVDVRNNFILFTAMCVAIRIGNLLTIIELIMVN